MDESPDRTKERIIAALIRAGGNRKRAAALLGIGRATLYRWLDRYQLERASLRVVAHRYEAISTLGEDAHASAFVVRDRALDFAERHAQLVPADSLDAASRSRIAAAIRRLVRLRHPHLVRVLDGGIDPETGQFFVVTDALVTSRAGDALSGRAPAEIVRALLPGIDALAFLHKNGLVHRAVCPDSFVVDRRRPERGVLLLPPRFDIENGGFSEGFDQHVAPEVTDTDLHSPRADVFALGVTLYVLLVRTGPLGEERSRPAAPSTLVAGVPPELDPIVLRMLAADPGSRYPDAGEALDALRSCVAAPPLRLRPPEEPAALAGRDAELAELADLLALDRSSLVLPAGAVVVGEPGIGKSWLFEAALEAPRSAGFDVIALRGDHEPGAALLDRLRSLLRDRDGENTASNGDATAQRVIELAQACATQRPLLVAVDDVERAGPEFLALLLGLARLAGGTRLRVLLAGRATHDEEAFTKFLAAAREEHLLAELPLGPLGVDAVRQLAARVLGDAPGTLVAADVHAHTGGRPHAVLERLRELSSGVVALPEPLAHDAHEHEGGARGLAELEHAVEHARRERHDDERLAEALLALVPALARDGRVERARALLHEASALVAHDRVPRLAFVRALAAARFAAHVGDVAGALALLEECTSASEPAPAVLRAEALEWLARLLLREGRYERALDAGHALLEHAARFDAWRPRVTALLLVGEALWDLDLRHAAAEHEQLALALASRLGGGELRERARLRVARHGREDLRLDAAQAGAREALSWAVTSGARAVAALARLELAMCRIAAGDIDQALLLLEEAEPASLAALDEGPVLRARLGLVRARARLCRGEVRSAIACAQEALGLAQAHGTAADVTALHAILTECEALLGPAGNPRVLLAAAHHVQQLADRIADPLARARFLARPDHVRLLAPPRAAGVDALALPGHDSQRAILDLAVSVLADIEAGATPGRVAGRVLAFATNHRIAHHGALLMANDGWHVHVSQGPAAALEADAARAAAELDRASAQAEAARLPPELRLEKSRSERAALFVIPLGKAPWGALVFADRHADAFASEAERAPLRLLAALVAAAAPRDASPAATTARPGPRFSFGTMTGCSRAMQSVFDVLGQAAVRDVPLLLTGEPGTGKSTAARGVHERSARATAPFVAVHTAGLDELALDRELFGAHAASAAKLREAQGGTLYLDDVGELTPALQGKLLRVLTHHEGITHDLAERYSVDARIVAGTRLDLAGLAQEGRFRRDLLLQLTPLAVVLPKLAERPEDVPLLFQHFLDRECARIGRPVPRVDVAVLRALRLREWPGNVRQLEALVTRLLLLTPGDVIGLDVLETDAHASGEPIAPVEGVNREEAEVRALRRALQLTGGNRARAAVVLGMGRATLYRKLTKHRLL